MERVITVVGKNGMTCSASLTAAQAQYYLLLAQRRSLTDEQVLYEFSKLIIEKSQRDNQQDSRHGLAAQTSDRVPVSTGA